jgi:hypothetical protein
MECFGEMILIILQGAVEGTIQHILLPPLIVAIELAAWDVHFDEQEKITIVYKLEV